jgi:hypothetical protein
MRFRFITISLLTLFTAAGGCGDDGGSGPGPTPRPDAGTDATTEAAADAPAEAGEGIPITELPTRFADTACAALTTCVGAAAGLLFAGEDCEQRLETQLGDALATIQSSIASGKVRYAGDKLQACLDALRNGGCVLSEAFESAACQAALDGTVEIGGGCQFNLECAGAAYCRSAGACPGTCTAREPAGQSCSHDDDCAPGLACSSVTDQCYRPAGLGAACWRSQGTECELGLYCKGDTQLQAGTCASFSTVLTGQAGAACDPTQGSLCAPELSCVIEGVNPLKSFCRARVAAGGACKIAFPDQCPVEQYCAVPENTLDGTCRPKPAEGQACVKATPLDSEATLCAPYLRCENGSCKALQKLGGSCQSSDVCWSQTCVGGKCAPEGSCG